MIEFKEVYIKYIPAFYSLYNLNHKFDCNTLIVGDAVNGSKAIMRIISKIDKHYTGTVLINNTDIKQIKDSELNVAYVPEKFELFKLKSVEKNLIFPLIIRKISKKQAKSMVFSILKQYNLENLLKIKAFKLNKNEQKIITLLRAIVRKPKYILLEDFFKDLDKSYYTLAEKIIKEISTESLIIACEESDNNLDCFKSFLKLELTKKEA